MDIRRMFTYDYNSNLENDSCPTNEIWYTSSDGNVVTPSETYVFGATITSNTYSNGKGVITFDGDVTTIGEWAFTYCRSLTSVTIPDSVTTIEDGAFTSCENLKNVTIPDSVTTIGEKAFYYCRRLTSVTIGNSVTTIGEDAFGWCPSLTSVYCKAITPPVLGNKFVFDDNGSGRKIYVPAGSVETYKSATRWSKYVDAIVGYDFEDGGGDNLITFTIDGIECQAEERMTWGEWVDSEYNVINAFSSGVEYISYNTQGVPVTICDNNYNYVNTTQEIITNYNYTSIGAGGGN